jgi:Flp pilus assembly protein TadG
MRNQRGSVTVEFALVGIPLIFALISTVEMSRGMWLYDTQAHAINEGVRYVVVRGVHCTSSGNACGATVGAIATHIANAGVGLVSSDWNVTLYSNSGSNNVTCNPLSSCLSNSTAWPPSPDNAVGAYVAISGSYTFNSALGMFWPGVKPVTFGTYNLPAYAKQAIQF